MPTVTVFTSNARYPQYSVSAIDEQGAIDTILANLKREGITDYRGPYRLEESIACCPTCGQPSASQSLTPLSPFSKIEAR